MTTMKKMKTNSTETTREKIIRDLAERIERRAVERFAVKSENVKKRLIDVMRSCWPNSGDATLAVIGARILSGGGADEIAILAEVRELNKNIVPGETPTVPYPGDRA